MQFSIAFLLGLTAACAFVLGTATWTPCSLNPVLATAIAAILTIALPNGQAGPLVLSYLWSCHDGYSLW